MRLYHLLPSLVLCFLLLPSPSGARDEPADIPFITAENAARIIKKTPEEYLVIDVRTPGEFAEGHLPDAKNIDFFGTRFEQEINALPKGKNILVYCRTGKRSAAAVESMRETGFKNVFNMTGGIMEWQKIGQKLEKR